MDIIRTTIYDFPALKKKTFLKKTEKTLFFFQFCPQMRKKRKNRHLVAYFEKSEKKRQNFAGFPSIFRFFGFVFCILGQKWKNLRKKKRRVFFVFPLRLGGGV